MRGWEKLILLIFYTTLVLTKKFHPQINIYKNSHNFSHLLRHMCRNIHVISTWIKHEYHKEVKSRIKSWIPNEAQKQSGNQLCRSVCVCFRKRQFNSMVLLKEYGSFVASHAFMPKCTGKGVLLSWGTSLYVVIERGAQTSNLYPTPFLPYRTCVVGVYIFFMLYGFTLTFSWWCFINKKK